MSKDIDTLSRERIVQDLDHNLFVEASAGSGKTTSLVNRMVALVEKGVPVDKICTITFTKAAADEFYARFQSLLSIRSVNVPDESDKTLGMKSEESVKRCQEALANIDLCCLGTIDAFTNMIAHEMPNEIGIPSDAVVIGEEEREALIKKQYEKILSSDSHPLHKYALRFKNIFSHSYDYFVIGVKRLLGKRNSVVNYDKSLIDKDENYFKVERDAFFVLAKEFTDLDLDFTMGSSDPKKADLERNELFKNIERDYQRYKDENIISVLGSMKYFIKNFEKIQSKKLGKAVEDTSLVLDGILIQDGKSYVLSEESLEIINALNHKIDDYSYSLFFYLVSGAVEEINAELKKQGKFDYNDFLYAVADAFKKSSNTDRELVDHIFERHSYFLLDESQDTNPVQTRMFFYLAGTKKSDDWTKVEPREGSLFIVGDPKQSIYCFRDADVKAYLNTKALFEKKGELLSLTKNFRSNVRIKQWLNQSMDDILNHDEDALEHKDIIIDEKEKNDDLMTPTVSNLLDGEYKYYIDPSEEYEKVAQFIHQAVCDKKYQIKCKNPDKSSTNPYIYRNIEYKDFLIVPRGTEVGGFIKSFNDYQIPMVVEANIPFSGSESLTALSYLVQLLKVPYDKHLIQEVLCGPLFKLDDGDITTMLAEGFNFDISDISNLSFIEQEYNDVIRELNRLYESTKGMGFSSTMMYIVNDKELSLLTRVNSDFFEYTYFLIEKVREKEESGLLSGVSQYCDYLKTFLASSGDENRVLRFKEKVNRVKIANLHKVKGLQAPIVMLVHPRKKIKLATEYMDNSTDPRTYHIGELSELDDEKKEITLVKTHQYSVNDYIKWEKYEAAERDRIEYVGATRPESVLIVASPLKEHGSFYNPWQHIVKHIGDDRIISLPNDVSMPDENRMDVAYNDPSINDSCNDQSIQYHSPSDIVKSYRRDNEDIAEEPLKYDNAALMGSMVHRLMECIVSSRDGYEDGYELVDSIVDEYSGNNESRTLLIKVLDTIYHGGFTQKNSSLDNDILKMLLKAKEVMCEVPFSYRENDTVIDGVVDLIYEDDNGYHIIDYKTNKEDDVSILEKEYASQLEDYVKAMKQMGVDADAHIYHIEIK